MENISQNSHAADVIVIGTGMGGLACASALSRVGSKVLCFEQHYVAGGMTHTFKRKNYVWDVGVHCMGEMDQRNPPRQMLDWLTQNQVVMHKYHQIYDRFQFIDGEILELPSHKDEYFDELARRFPTQKRGLKKYQTAIHRAAKSGYGHFFTKLLPPLLDNLLSPILGFQFRKWARKTTRQVIDECVTDKKLASILTAQWGYYGPPPSKSSFYIHAVTTKHFWYGAYYPKGGAKVFADSMVKTITDQGGQVLTRATVKKILFDNNKAVGVELTDGRIFNAPTIVSAIGVRATLQQLLPAEMTKNSWGKSLLKLGQSPCHVALYLGLDEDITDSGARASNQWFYESYDMEKTEWNVSDENSVAPILYVSFPSLKDPDHKGGHTCEVVTFVPYAPFRKWEGTMRGKRGDDYQMFKKNLEERLLAQLFKWLPNLKKHVLHVEFSTPLSTVHYCKSPEGAIYGISPTPERFATKELKPETPYKNFYLSGSDVGTLGVVGAMVGGFLTAAKLRPKIWKSMRQNNSNVNL